MVVAHLVLDELGVPAVFDEVCGVGAAQRMQIQSGRQLQVIAVSTESAKQCAFGHQGAFLAGK